MKQKHEAGFSLLEMMITLLIVAVIGGISVPVLGNLYSNFRMRASVEGLVSEIQLAKFKAINLNTTVTLSISGSNRTYQLQGEGLKFLHNSVSFQGTPPAMIGFDSRGRLSSGTETTLVLMGRGGATATITINPSGRITVS